MKRILLFPYHPDVELLAAKASELKGYCIAGVHSFKEDASVTEAVNGKLGCTGTFAEMLKQCDIVLLLDGYRELRTEKYYEVIQSALAEGKQVVVTPIAEQKLDLEAYKGNYTVLRDTLEAELLGENEAEPIKYTIETPVIAVFGMGKNCCKFENQILLKSILDREGCRSVWISSNPLGALFGGHSMPDFLFDRHLALEEKVIRFNHFVYQISAAQKPDVFVIGIPEGISEFAEYEYNHFGEYPLAVGSAVQVDSAVLCTYFLAELRVEGVEKLASHCREKFGLPVHMVSIGRTAFEKMQELKQISYLFLEEEYLQKHYKAGAGQPDTYVGIWEAQRPEAAAQKIFDRLWGNPDVL